MFLPHGIHRLFPGGIGCLFDDRPFWGRFNFSKWINNLLFYYDGRFSAGVALPFAALDMMCRMRSFDQSGRFLKNRVAAAPSNAV